jgi:RNA polymerase sigma-70 factor (ECF subfamily)
MGVDPPPDTDDAALARRLSRRDQGALRLLLERHGGRVRQVLRKRYQGVLDESEVDQVVLDAAFAIWRNASKFERSRGGLGGWFMSIALRAAVDILRGEHRDRYHELGFDPAYVPLSWGGGTTTTSGRQGQLIVALNEAIARLPRLQREVIRADLAADGQADSSRLARRLGSTEGSVYAARSKAHAALYTMLSEKGHAARPQRSRR